MFYLFLKGVIGVDEIVKWSYCLSVNECNKVILIFMLVEKVGMFMGFILIVWVMYVILVVLYVYFVDRSWESDKDLINVKDDFSNCKDIGNVFGCSWMGYR